MQNSHFHLKLNDALNFSNKRFNCQVHDPYATNPISFQHLPWNCLINVCTMCVFDFTLVCFQTVEWCLTTPIVPARTLHAQLSKTSRRTLPNRARKLQEGRPLLRCRNERNDSRYQTRTISFSEESHSTVLLPYHSRAVSRLKQGQVRGALLGGVSRFVLSVMLGLATYRAACAKAFNTCALVFVVNQNVVVVGRSVVRSVGLSGNAGVHGFSSFSHFQLLYGCTVTLCNEQTDDVVGVFKKCMLVLCGVSAEKPVRHGSLDK